MNFLDFEQPIAELDAKIDELKLVNDNSAININEELTRLKHRSDELIQSIFSSLSAWQYAQLARHPQRPYTLDYIERIFTDFEELHGDRNFADDPAIVCGIARLQGLPVAIIGHQKGRSIKERIYRNYGMPKPEGYRKALRVMELAEQFRLPLLTFIDTPGAYPGIGAEERGQSAAIAKNLVTMATLKTPIIATVIGEGGSGGALAIGIADKLFMLQYSTYSVISPEGCASILWKDIDKAEEAANIMGITAKDLKKLGLADQIIDEPLGAAHRDYDHTAASLKAALLTAIREAEKHNIDDLLSSRQSRIRQYGNFES